MHFKVGDTVTIRTGKDRTKVGKVERIIKNTNRAIVGGLNVAKVHLKPGRSHPQGGIIDKAASLHVSNLMIVCPRCSRPTRAKIKTHIAGRTRICSKCKEALND